MWAFSAKLSEALALGRGGVACKSRRMAGKNKRRFDRWARRMALGTCVGPRKGSLKGPNVQRQIKGFAGGILMLALSGVAMAAPPEDGWAAYQKHDYATALQILRPWADLGNGFAQTYLDIMYEWRRASRSLVPQGRRPGECPRAEQPRRVVRARPRRAAGRRTGSGVVAQGRRPGRRRRAEQPRRGVHDGRGVPQDYVRALMWLDVEQPRAHPPSDRDKMAKNRDDVAAKMTPAQIAEAELNDPRVATPDRGAHGSR